LKNKGIDDKIKKEIITHNQEEKIEVEEK